MGKFGMDFDELRRRRGRKSDSELQTMVKPVTPEQEPTRPESSPTPAPDGSPEDAKENAR